MASVPTEAELLEMKQAIDAALQQDGLQLQYLVGSLRGHIKEFDAAF